MTEVTNILMALRLLSSLTKEVTNLVQTAQREGRDITDEELNSLRQQSQDALDRWLEMDENS